jgi:hypothetical protein
MVSPRTGRSLPGSRAVLRLFTALRRRGGRDTVPEPARVGPLPHPRSRLNMFVRAGAAAALVAGALVGAAATAGTARAATSGPCDIYASGGTPCVAAHSTTRALYSSYTGPLYQVRRASDNTYKSFSPTTAGGYPDAAAQDSFCAGTTCVITRIYDQSGRGNDLTQAPGGGAAGGPDNLANATAAPTTVAGHKAYGVYVAPGTGYRNDNTNGIATGDNPEGMYAIFDGTHYNGGCCFDYGNAETNNNDDGNGTMEAIYFGNIKVWGYGSGNGPWIMADLENGLFSGVNKGYNANDPTVNYRYTTAIVKGGPNHWAIRGGNAQSGGLSTFYDGVRPNVSGYNPMKKQGAIILGIGGDNSNGAAGTFYEGVMTSGYPSDATENAVQANITSVGYANSSSGGGSQISLKAHANGKYVTAEDGGSSPLIANRDSVGYWETFDEVDLGNGNVALNAHADNKYVTAENGGSSPLIANRDTVGQWETFQLVHNSDGSISLKAAANGKYVTADNAGSSPLIANRDTIGQWEEFDLNPA